MKGLAEDELWLSDDDILRLGNAVEAMAGFIVACRQKDPSDSFQRIPGYHAKSAD